MNNIKLKPGSTSINKANNPVIGITGKGKYTYLWVGNDAENSKWCFATVSGPKKLEKFAKEILKAVSPKTTLTQ